MASTSASSTSPAPSILASRAPIVHTFSTPDLLPILARSGLPSFNALLTPFDTIDRVNVRSSTYEARLLPRFSVRFVERELPTGFGDAVGEGTVMGHHRARSGTVNSLAAAGGLPHMPSLSEPSPVPTASPLPPPTSSTPFYQPNQAERDELFLDSLSSLVSQRVDGWIGQTGREELAVRAAKSNKRGEDSEADVEADEGWDGRSIEALTPWYATMRDEVLRRREMVEWETFSWPVGCLLALSTSHPDPLSALSALWDLTSPEKIFASSSYPPRSGAEEDGRHDWANPDILRYIVLVHDFGAGGGRDAWEDAKDLHETIRKTYGLHTALLPLFSAAPTAVTPQPRARGVDALWNHPGAPAPFVVPERTLAGLNISNVDAEAEPATATGAIELGQELSEDDLKALRIFIREMVVQSILPWMERSVVVGNEQFAASKRSIGGRLFSAGRKYFGGSSASSRAGSPVSASGAPIGFNAVKGFYPHAAQESQTRRLADLAFMIGDYKLAASVYEQASKDYKTERAWRYFASACRMAGLSQLLMHPPSTPLTFNPDVWLEQALQTPLSSNAGGVDLDGLQAMMLYYETYRAIGDWRPAPVGLVRTAGEADELSSALLLEQAAIADLHLPMPSRRKYAFHMSMAAARYEKSGMKSLSRRCLSQAASVYRIDSSPTNDPHATSTPLTGWNAIRSHLHHGLGRQAYNVGKADEAVEHFLELLVGAGVQGDEAAGEESWLDDFGLAWEHLGADADRIVAERGLKLQATIFDAKDAHVRILQNGDVSAVEVDSASEAWKDLETDFLASGFVGQKKPLSLSKAGKGNEAVVGETFFLELFARNPLDAALAIGGLRIETDAEAGTVEIDAPQEVELAPREALRIYVPVRAASLVNFSFTKLSFRFNDLLLCTETLVGKPKRLNATREQLVVATYSEDSSLVVNVRSPVPTLSVNLDSLPDRLYAGETRLSSILVTNASQVPLSGLKGLCSHPSFAMFHEDDSPRLYDPSPRHDTPTTKIPNRIVPNTPFTIRLGESLDTTTLAPGASIRLPILCRGDAAGSHILRWLFAFCDEDQSEHLTSRVAHSLEVLPSLDVRPSVRPSNSSSSPYILGVEIHNNTIPSDVVITQISSLSPQWRCKALDALGSAELGVLGWRQSANLFLAVEAQDSPDGFPGLEDGTAFAVRKLDALLQGKDVKSSVPGDTGLVFGSLGSGTTSIDSSASPLFNSILQTHTRLRHAHLAAQLPTIPSTLHEHLFPLFDPLSIDLLVFWTVPSSGVSGHHHLTDISLGVSANMLKEVLETAELKAGGLYAESQRERSTLLAGLRRCEFGADQNPAAVMLEFEELVDHDFEAPGACSVPVSFFIRNLSTTLPFEYTLTLQASEPSSLPLAYAGSLTRTGTATSLSLTPVIAQLWIPRAGTFDVGDWRLDVRGASGKTWTRLGLKRELRVRDLSRPVVGVEIAGT